MELRVLKYFLTVAEEKTISKAAETLHLTQPTLSKQLKELEEELQVTLFHRGSREITLTEEGIYLRNRANEILSLVNATTINLQKDELIAGEINIGSGETRGFQLIADNLNILMANHQEVRVNLFSGNADDITEKIDKGLLDFGLVIDPVDKQKYEYLPLPNPDIWGVLVADTHPLAEMNSITPNDLSKEKIFISKQSQVSNQLASWFGQNIEHLEIVGTYNLLYNASLLVKNSNHVVLCIEGIINTHQTGLSFIPLSPSLTANINLIWKKRAVFSSAANYFLSVLKKET